MAFPLLCSGRSPFSLLLVRCYCRQAGKFRLIEFKHSLAAAKRVFLLRGSLPSWSKNTWFRYLPRSLLVPGSVAFYRGLHTVALCKSRSGGHAPSSRHTPSKTVSTYQLQWRQLWGFIKDDVILLLIAVASAVIAAILNTLIPLRIGELVNTVAHLQPGLSLSSYLSRLTPTAMSLITLYVAQSVCTFGYISVLSVVGERLATRIRSALFRSLIQQDMSFFDERKTGELISRLSGDVQDLKSSFKLVISQGLRSITQGAGCLVSLYIISPQMTGGVCVVLPAIILVGTMFGSVLRKWSRNAQEQVAIATGVADEAIGNIRTVRAFAMEESEHRLYQQQLMKSEWASVKLGNGIALFQALSNLAINGVVLGVVSHGGLLLTSSQLSAGDLMAFLVATQTIQRSLGTLSILFGQVVRAVSAGGRVMEYMNVHPSVSLHGGERIDDGLIQGSVAFKDITFSYPSRNDQVVLSHFSLELPPGQVTALCGLSGAGKSTVAALLERFYEPDNGEIRLDGHRLSSLDPSWLREEVIGYINQEPVLFGTTVMENIRYGCPTASDDDVIAAAKLANAHKFIQQFPRGYTTLVGERGVALSGGQKQRVAIARALLKNPKILILDEATSALDAHSESLVQEALDRACKGRTVLVIAHRLSTIRGADQIAVLHHGQLREVGSHSELVAKRGLYSELIRRQTVIN